jgi:hypothetical protein
MRRLLAGISLGLFASLGFTGAAAATPVHQASCLAHYDWHTGVHIVSLERYGVADWESQCSPEISMQLRIGCHSFVTGQSYNDQSGIVRALELDNETHCGPTDAATFLAIRFNGGLWKTLCSPCPGWRRSRTPTDIQGIR